MSCRARVGIVVQADSANKIHTVRIMLLTDCVYSVYILFMNSAALIKEMKKAGWIEVRVRGSHHQFRHPDHGHSVTVPHPKKDLGKGLVAAIRKQAGLK